MHFQFADFAFNKIVIFTILTHKQQETDYNKNKNKDFDHKYKILLRDFYVNSKNILHGILNY